jgi:tetratricopeptide (TPR) repeat protein
MSQCEVRAALAGYRSTKVKLGRRSVFESPDIGSIILIPMAKGEEPSRDPLVSVNTLKAPAKAVKYFEEGQKQLFKDKPNTKKAAKELEKATEEYPEFSSAWNLLAEARLQNQDMEGARQALQKAVETDPGFVTPKVTLASLELEEGNFQAAIEASKSALKIVPDMGEPLYYQGTAYAKMGDLENARSTLEKVALGPEEAGFPKSHYILGVIYAQSGDLKKAVEHCRRYLELEPDSAAADAVRKQLSNWEAGGVIQ